MWGRGRGKVGGGGVLRPRRALVIHRHADVICDAFICAVAGNEAIAHLPHYGAAATVVVSFCSLSVESETQPADSESTNHRAYAGLI